MSRFARISSSYVVKGGSSSAPFLSADIGLAGREGGGVFEPVWATTGLHDKRSKPLSNRTILSGACSLFPLVCISLLFYLAAEPRVPMLTQPINSLNYCDE